MGGEPGNLKPIKGMVATTNEVTLTTKVDATFDCGFTRGILSTQWLARFIGTLPDGTEGFPDGTPNFQKIIDALEDYKNPDNVIRKHLMANAPEMLMAPIKECVEDGGHVYAALYELSANQLVDFLLEHLKYFSMILGNTGAEDFTNAPARKALHEAGADEGAERIRKRAEHRAEHEHAQCRAEDRTGSEPVGHPARDRDEDREADQIGGHGQLQRDRVLTERLRDDRQRGGDHRRVGVLHEQRTGDDQGQELGALQGRTFWRAARQP